MAEGPGGRLSCLTLFPGFGGDAQGVSFTLGQDWGGGKARPTGDSEIPQHAGRRGLVPHPPWPSLWDEKLLWGTEPASGMGMGCSQPSPQNL